MCMDGGESGDEPTRALGELVILLCWVWWVYHALPVRQL